MIALTVACGLSAGAAAASQRTALVCTSHVVLVESPGGAITGIVHRHDVVQVLTGSAHARWWRVRTNFGTRGWLRRHYLC